MNKNNLILLTSQDITDFLLRKHGVEVDYLEIAELININMRHILKKLTDEE